MSKLAKPRPDGRVERGARNHTLIVQAMYDLIRGGQIQPTMDEVARRAGVGTRTVFRQFQDIETLYRSLGERVQRDALEGLVPIVLTSRLTEDLSALVARRAILFERLTPFRRAGRLVRHQSSFLAEQDARMAQALRVMLELVVSPHLAPRSEDTLEALDALLSFEAWDRLRDQQGLGRDHAVRVLTGAATTLVTSARRKRAPVRT